MTSLESTIIELTRATANGGCCHIADATIVVRYCSDIWEWEYRGETYWDVQDLAEAITRDDQTICEKRLHMTKWTKAKKADVQTEKPLTALSMFSSACI